ncbi:hypothetical protein EVAR_27499_1 [Eumeta japonica]|uniref:Uncharacterized protein n=1 Tax=Eumeta variegata TaxID=151549 RepID=A0A4C1XF56_EUMVA|nr:hypothetical protein EVAR_27499_1 [Eumeta japonica]
MNRKRGRCDSSSSGPRGRLRRTKYWDRSADCPLMNLRVCNETTLLQNGRTPLYLSVEILLLPRQRLKRVMPPPVCKLSHYEDVPGGAGSLAPVTLLPLRHTFCKNVFVVSTTLIQCRA